MSCQQCLAANVPVGNNKANVSLFVLMTFTCLWADPGLRAVWAHASARRLHALLLLLSLVPPWLQERSEAVLLWGGGGGGGDGDEWWKLSLSWSSVSQLLCGFNDLEVWMTLKLVILLKNYFWYWCWFFLVKKLFLILKNYFWYWCWLFC